MGPRWQLHTTPGDWANDVAYYERRHLSVGCQSCARAETSSQQPGFCRAGSIASSQDGEGHVRPTRTDDKHQLNPLANEGGEVSGQEQEAGKEQRTKEQFEDRVKELEHTLMEHWEYTVKDEENHVPILKVPAKPTEAEWLEHQVTHTPPRTWCKFCMMGRGVRRGHRRNVPDIEPNDGGPNKLSMDYMYLDDEHGAKDLPQLVVIDHNHGRYSLMQCHARG